MRHLAPVEEVLHDQQVAFIFVFRLGVAEADAINAEDLSEGDGLTARNGATHVVEIPLGKSVLMKKGDLGLRHFLNW